jgi:hypothetical protein
VNNYFYNNIGICATSIISVLEKSDGKLELNKVPLIMPFITHKQLLSYLSNKKITILSLDSLIIDKNHYFTNFNKRFYESLTLTINAIQFLNDIESIQIYDNKVKLIKSIKYHKSMGTRSEKIYKASQNITTLLNESSEKLYLNLRIQL